MTKVYEKRRLLTLGAATVAAFVITATPAHADPVLTPLIAAAISSIAPGLESFSIFGISIGTIVTGLMTTTPGRGLIPTARR